MPTIGASGSIYAPNRRRCASSKTAAATLLPHFGSLLQDIFSLLFKYNIKLSRGREVLPSALLNRNFLHAIHNGAQYEFLREQTLLNEAHAGLSTLILGERLLALVREEKFLTRRDMRDLWDIQKQEEIVGRKSKNTTTPTRSPRINFPKKVKRLCKKPRKRWAAKFKAPKHCCATRPRSSRKISNRSKRQATNRMQAEAIKVAQELEDATEEAETWGNTIGTGEKSPPGQKLELGRRLAGNEKLKKLARMVGRMKFHAQALRKKVFERSSEELLEVEQGDSLHRLLPHEMLMLAPSDPAQRLLPPLSRPGVDPILTARRRRKRQRADDRLPRRQLVHVRRQGDLVQSGDADACWKSPASSAACFARSASLPPRRRCKFST